MRGVTYRFSIDSTTNTNHPFEIYYKSGSNNTLTKANKSGNIIDVEIPSDQTVVAGDLYYICTSHDMSGNLGLLYKDLTNESPAATAPGQYDFFYGNITVQVIDTFESNTLSGNTDEISVYCFNHGYMGGQQKLVYNASCPAP